MSNCVLLQEEPILTELVKTTICCCSVTKSNLTLAIPWTVTLQALVAISFFRGSSWPRDQTCTSCIAHRFFITESPGKYPVLSSTVYNSQDTEAILMSNKRWMDKDTHTHTHTLEYYTQFNSVQLLSHVRLFATPWITARQASLSITNSWRLPKLTSIESVMPSGHLILCRPLLLLPPIPPSIRVFSNESTLHMR